jgi:hypothetical protein
MQDASLYGHGLDPIELIFGLFAMLGGGMLPYVVPPVLCAAVIVAICTLFESRKSTQGRPKDASF